MTSLIETEALINELQTTGVRLVDPKVGADSRRGGAGPSDHKALTIDGMTVMIPVHTAPAFDSPYEIDRPNAAGRSRLTRDGQFLGEITFPARPRFYDLKTADGVPYSHIAVLHGRDVLATTVLQTCIRYQSRTKTCQFCAIGQSLAAGRTIERKTPEQLAEVAKAAVELDGVRHMVMTTGTPPGRDRGAAILAESARAVKAAVDLPIQVQCEPPDDFAWFGRMKEAGADALGMHLEAVSEPVRRRIMPGKAQASVKTYFEAFAAAVPVFGRGQVSTYILAGLGDSVEDILGVSERLVGLGVYPFVVPFVPITGTPLESHPTPPPAFMHAILGPLSRMLVASGLKAVEVKAGCAKCGACSALSTYERGLEAKVEVAEAGGMIFEPVLPFVASDYRIRYATEAWEKAGAAALRRQVFCTEQGLFEGDDRDETDEVATPIVAVAMVGCIEDEVVGTVRIHEAEPGIWWGSRLAVASDYRRIGMLGTQLIRLAVSSAHARGARRFFAHVQSQNAPLFHRLNWTTHAEIELRGWPHHRMEADLTAYPPFATPETGFHAHRKVA